MGKILSWGQCRIVYKKSGAAAWAELPTPVEGTTTLNTTKGSKTEAKIEGGSNEAVRYGKNTYELDATIRLAKGTKKPFKDEDGIVAGEHSVCVIPENIEAPGLYIESCNISLEDNYTSADGVQLTYAFDALAGTGGDQLKWGVFTLTETTKGDISTASAFKVTEVQVEGESAPSAIDLI